MRSIIPLLNLMKELKYLLLIDIPVPVVKCTAFEDNMSTIAVARAPSMLPRTKHIGIKYHHFRSFVQQGKIDINYVSTNEQMADIFTKPIPAGQFKYLRK